MPGELPTIPNAHAAAVMLLTVVAFYLFSREKHPLEVTSLGLLVVLSAGFTLVPFEVDGQRFQATRFFEGFGHEALIAVCALMIVGQGLVATGALEPLGRALAKSWARQPFLSFAATLILTAVLSAFVNNTPIVVLLLPVLIPVCLRSKTSAAGVLMPVGFSSLVGGMATTIGTSTNLLVVSVAADLGVRRFDMFDFALPACLAGAVAIIYLWLVAPRLLPDRKLDLADGSPRFFQAHLRIDEDSLARGKSLAEAIALTGGAMRVVRVRRGSNRLYPLPDVVLRAGDRLRVQDTPRALKAYEDSLGATLYSGGHVVDDEHPLKAEGQVLAEVAVVRGSILDHTNLSYARFLERFQLVVVALHRVGKDIMTPSEEIQDVTLMFGDVLLVQGPKEQIGELKRNPDFLVLDAGMDLPHTTRAPLALAILAGVVIPAALGIMPIAISALTGATLMVITRCLDIGTALRAIRPSVFFVVVASLALGRALVDTGATHYVTELFLAFASGAPPVVVLSGLMLLLALLTNVVSNNAAGVIGTPIAVGIASQLGLPPEPFVLAVLFGANMSFATPMAYQTNLLVMSAGNYRFAEFVKVGVPLMIIMWLLLTWLLNWLYL